MFSPGGLEYRYPNPHMHTHARAHAHTHTHTHTHTQFSKGLKLRYTNIFRGLMKTRFNIFVRSVLHEIDFSFVFSNATPYIEECRWAFNRININSWQLTEHLIKAINKKSKAK